MSYTRVKFEQTHIIRPASEGTFRRFSQTLRFDPLSRPRRIPLFGALGHYVILMQYTPGKPCCQAIFPISGRFFCQAPAFVAHPVPCPLCAFLVLLFEFCTFSPKTPLCILYRFALVFWAKEKHPGQPECFALIFIVPIGPANSPEEIQHKMLLLSLQIQPFLRRCMDGTPSPSIFPP